MMTNMCGTSRRDYELIAEEYEKARRAWSKQMKGENHPMYGKRHTEEAKRKMSEKRKGQPSPNKGKKMSQETKQKLRERQTGKKYSAEVNKKKGLPGEKNPFFGKTHSKEVKKKLSAIHKGKHLSEETRKKISDALKGENNPFYGKKHSEEAKKKIGEANKGRLIGDKHPSSRITCQYDLNMHLVNIWVYVKQAANELNIHKDSISNCCHMKIKTAGGFIWRYLYDVTRRDGTITPGAITLGLITEEEAFRMLKD